MPYSRQRPRLAPTGRVAVRLTPPQRDQFIHSGDLPAGLGQALHRAVVREGKLSVRVTRDELDLLIRAGAKLRPADRRAEREMDTLLRYLEGLEDRFAEPPESTE